jgi:DNA-binding response OmpR family regulator
MAKKILIIDDEQDLVAVVKLRLEANNFLVSEAFTAKEGLKKAEEQRPDAILLDILLPDSDGYEVCQRLKSNSKTQNIPIIIFTASDLRGLAKKAINAGAIDYVIKPFEPKDILEKINKAIK